MGDAGLLGRAIELARASVRTGGGPFGALVVREDRIIARGSNRVVAHADPTAHAEIVALREAARALGTHALAGCALYASCEPCPMCFGALRWARIDRLVYAASRDDAAEAGFDDARIYEELTGPPEGRGLIVQRALETEGLVPFREWRAASDRVSY